MPLRGSQLPSACVPWPPTEHATNEDAICVTHVVVQLRIQLEERARRRRCRTWSNQLLHHRWLHPERCGALVVLCLVRVLLNCLMSRLPGQCRRRRRVDVQIHRRSSCHCYLPRPYGLPYCQVRQLQPHGRLHSVHPRLRGPALGARLWAQHQQVVVLVVGVVLHGARHCAAVLTPTCTR